jgi:cation diffusion facilitator CzcD-associated flavoprotein CzcO
MTAVDVAIVGAGPYGLALAAHLTAAGVEHRIFGRPMAAWAAMSPGMHLKSVGFATTIPTGPSGLTLPEFCRSRGEEDYEPIPISTFGAYGAVVQQAAVPEVEPVDVVRIADLGGSFRLDLADGPSETARRVVVATGLSGFERIPAPFDGLPPDLAGHTSAWGDLTPLGGRDVTVVGAGQSALQAAALLHEQGAEVRVLARGDVHWGWRGLPDDERSLVDRVRVPMSVLGHGRDNWILQHFPALPHHRSDAWRLQFLHAHLGPSGAWWLRDRVDGIVAVRTGTPVVSAVAEGEKVRLGLGDGEDLVTEFVVLGTGYRVDVDRMAFLDGALARRLDRLDGAPRLDRCFESSVPGLHFVGPASMASFGPLFRFVAGAGYTSKVLTRRLRRL